MAMERGSSSSSICNTSSTKEKRMNNDDLISGLPEPLLHHILSFMDMKEVVHCSLISKRWRYLWKSLRVLSFDAEEWCHAPKFKLKKGKFKYFVDTVLLLREGTDVSSFKLWFQTVYENDFVRIDRWINYAISHRVQSLELLFVHFPASSLRLCGHVNTLILYGLWFDGRKRELVLDLPLVENLTIHDCDHRAFHLLTITGPKLKHLKFDHERQGYNDRTAVKICAPNLVSLNCTGYMYEDYIFESPSALTTAEIDTKLHWIDETTPPDEVFIRCMSNILKELARAESLILSVYGFQCCSGFPNLLDGVLVRCTRVKHLKLWGWFDCLDSDSVAKLLESFPNLETIVVQKNTMKLDSQEDEDRECSQEDDDIEYGEELPFESKFHHLKSLEIHNFEGTENELKFIEVLLQNALVLENVTIISTIISSDKEKEMVSFSEKIQFLQRASPGITILLNLKRKW